MSIKFKKLNNSIVKCKSCPRLIAFSKKISIEKRKQNIKKLIGLNQLRDLVILTLNY